MNNRLEYIDALRGITMILVVFAHVECFGFYKFGADTNVGDVFYLFRMPLFFFISGFVLILTEKKIVNFDCWSSIKKKIRVLIIPTLILGLIYTYFKINEDVTFFIENTAKSGYWFTLVSFEMFVIYYVIKKVFSKKYLGVLIGLSVAFVLLKLPMKLNETLCYIGNVTSFHYLFEYFQYFVFGVLISKSKEILDRSYIDKIVGLALILFILLVYVKIGVVDSLTSNINYKVAETLLCIIIGYLGIVVAFCAIRKYQASFTNKTIAGKALLYIGRRTLDIYLLHYFFLPTLPMVGDFFKEYPNMVLELTVGIVLSLLIIGVCLIVSNVLRTSDIIGYWLFGAKKIENK